MKKRFNVMQGLKKVLAEVYGYIYPNDVTDEEVRNALNNESLSIYDKDGKIYLWYLDEIKNICLNLTDGNFLTEEEIENLV